jgi:hypothetical protein
VADTTWDTAVAAMRAAGERDGKAAGSWIADGNTSEAALRRTLQLWEDGDPEAPSAPHPFSGEWADSPRPEDIIDAETEDYSGWSMNVEEVDELASAYEDAYAQAWQEEAERTVRALLPK